MRNLYKATDIKEFSKAFGSVGMSRAQVVIVQQSAAANQNEPEVIPVRNINISLVKMIDQLAALDGYLKQKLDNQISIDRNMRMSERESQIESTQQQKPEVIQKDAEKVGGSGAGLGLLGAGALGLLAFEPVRDAIGSLVGIAADAGKFATSVLGSINSLFSSMFSGTPDATAQPVAEGNTPGTPAPATTGGETPSTESPPVPAPQAIPEQKPGLVASALTGALVGGAAGSIIPGVGSGIGAAAGAAIGAYNYFTTPSSPTSSTSTPTATGGPTTAVTPATNPTQSKSESKPQQVVAAGEIPKNDIVALGNYLVSKGAERHKLQHPAFGPVGKHSKNSRHYRGMAIDVNFPGANEPAILDALEPQLRAAGYNTIWRKAGHTTHMHVSVGGPEGKGGIGSYGDIGSMGTGGIVGEVASTMTAGIEETAKILGAVAGALVGKTTLKSISTPLPDMSSFIQENSIQEKAAIVQSKVPKALPKPAPPNINMSGSSATIQNPPTMSDRNRLYYYIDRFGFEEVNKPTLVKSATA